MARRLRWSQLAADDLDEIAAYIARDSKTYAAAFVTRIREAARSLLEMPERGRIMPEYRDVTVRELIVDNYRLVYRIKSEEIGIVGVIHGARQMPDNR